MDLHHKIVKKISYTLVFCLCFVSIFSGMFPTFSYANEKPNLSKDLCAKYGIDENFEGELIIQYKKIKKHNTLRSLFSQSESTPTEQEPILYNVESGEDVSDVLEDLTYDGEIEYIEPNRIYRICKNLSDDLSERQTVNSTVYNNNEEKNEIKEEISKEQIQNESKKDTTKEDEVKEEIKEEKITEEMQEDVKDKYIDYQWALKDIQAFDAWKRIGKNKHKAVVAVLDTGVDYHHPDLEGKIIEGENFVKERQNGSKYPYNYGVIDDNGHGTFASGVISAHYNNKLGIAGLAGDLNVEILAVKVMNDEGEGNIFEISEGIRYAADKGADIINLSLGGEGYSQTMANAVKYAQEKGVLVVAAAGNDGKDGSNFYPAAYPGVLTVGAIGVDDSIAKFSNYGEALDIMAPGVQIYSTSIPKEAQFGNEEEGYYAQFNGTSFACPYTAGVAAVYKIVHPNTTPEEIKEALIQTTVDLEDIGWDEKTGYGKLNMYAAVNPNMNIDRLIKIEGLKRNDYLKDEVTLKANILKDQDEIDKVVFYLDKISKDHKIGEMEKGNSNKYSIHWNTKDQKNGSYELIAAAYAGEEVKGTDTISVKIINEVTNGILLEVKDPDGNVAVNSFVNVYVKDPEHNNYDRIYTGKTNELGLTRIPGTLGKDLKKVYVMIQGSFDCKEMKRGTSIFMYQRELEGPGEFKITGENTQAVQFKTINKGGSEITDVAYYATVVDKDGINIGTTNELNNNKEMAPVIFIDEGDYDFFSYSKKDGETYFLTQWAKHIQKGSQKYEMLFDGTKTGQVHLVTDTETKVKSGIVYLYNDKTNTSLGMKLGGENIYVSADTYRYKIDANVADPENKQDWIYTFDSGKTGIVIPENEVVDVKVGGGLHISHFDLSYEAVEDHVLEANKTYNPESIQFIEENGETIVKFPIGYELFQTMNRFSDDYGNFLCQISRGNLSKASIVKQEDTLQVQDDDEDDSKVLLPRFRVLDENDEWIYPIYWDLMGGHEDGEKSKNFFELTFWDIMSLDGKTGDYHLQLSLEENPLSKEKLAKQMTVRLYDEGIHKIVSHDPKMITKHVSWRNALTVPYVYIYSLKKGNDVDAVSSASLKEENPMGGGEVDAVSTASINSSSYHWEQTYGSWGNKYQDEDDFGTVALDSSIKLSKEKNGNLAVIRYTLADDKTYIYLFKPFTTFDDLDTEIHLDKLDLKKVTLHDFEMNNKEVEHMQNGINIIYQPKIEKENKTMPIRMPIFTKDVWVENGDYSFDGQFITHADANGNQTNYYVVAKDIKVDEDKEIHFDASKNAKIILDPIVKGYKKWKGAALLPFSNYNHTFKIEESQGSIFYVPADIDYDSMNIVLGLADNEKPSYIWNYLLQMPKSLKLEAGKEYTIKVGGTFKPLVELQKNSFKNNDKLIGYAGVLDEFGNRLLSTRISANHEWFDVNRKDTTTTLYNLSHKGICASTYADKEDYVIQHDTTDDANIVYPYMRLYKIENGVEKVLYNESKAHYYHGFDESLVSLLSGDYRVEMAFAGSPNGPVFTSKNEGLFKMNTNSSNSGSSIKGSSSGGGGSNKTTPKPTEEKQNPLNSIDLEKFIQKNKKEINISLEKDHTKASFTVDSLNLALKENKDMIIHVKGENGEYSLPISSLDMKKLQEKLGQAPKKISVSIEPKEKDNSIKDILSNKNVKILSTPVEFKVFALGENNSSVEIKDFNNLYINAIIPIEKTFNKNKATAVSYDPKNNSYDFVPTTFKEIDGKWIAKIKSSSNYMITIVEGNKTFDDVQTHWAKKEIENLASRFIIKGMNENTFAPDSNITRAEFVTLLVKALGLKNTESNKKFVDINSNDWYKDFVLTGAHYGLINGYEDGSFKPNQPITRQEMAVIIEKAMKLGGKAPQEYDYDKTLKVFDDQQKISDWSKGAISTMIHSGIASGRTASQYAPTENTTRAETSIMVYRLLKFIDFIE
ncbi:S8 family serine peptidase [Inediibacterium massiliense]|uniref:S8 family serine peptidase n=1 Tax=Inediibacterium massiliense TaxID=1658111 RepID=UPI0006B45DF1|nr:S8 family serine peptidase [Inediibacterium massiliense]